MRITEVKCDASSIERHRIGADQTGGDAAGHGRTGCDQQSVIVLRCRRDGSGSGQLGLRNGAGHAGDSRLPRQYVVARQ